MRCPYCFEEVFWKASEDKEDVDGNKYIENFYECADCDTFISIARKVEGV